MAADTTSSDPAFLAAYGEAVRRAAAGGVEVYAFGCSIALDDIRIDRMLPADLRDQRLID